MAMAPFHGQERRAASYPSFYVQAVARPVAYSLQSLGHLRQYGQVVPHKGRPLFPSTQEVEQLAFRLYHPGERAEALQVSFPYVGDDAVVWLGNACQQAYIARVAGSHFDDGKLMFGL